MSEQYPISLYGGRNYEKATLYNAMRCQRTSTSSRHTHERHGYTKLLCARLAADFKDDLNIRHRQRSMFTEQIPGSSSSNPLRDMAQKWEPEEEEMDERQPQGRPREIVDTIEPEELPLDTIHEPKTKTAKQVAEDENKQLGTIAKIGQQLANGGQRTFQTSPKMKLLQELYGDPVGYTLKIVELTKKPPTVPTPEPLFSRSNLSHYLVITQDTSKDNWSNKGWR